MGANGAGGPVVPRRYLITKVPYCMFCTSYCIIRWLLSCLILDVQLGTVQQVVEHCIEDDSNLRVLINYSAIYDNKFTYQVIHQNVVAMLHMTS